MRANQCFMQMPTTRIRTHARKSGMPGSHGHAVSTAKPSTCVLILLQPYGSYLLSSLVLEPGTGWDYTALTKLIDAQGQATPVQLGQWFITSFVAQVLLAART